MRYWSILIGALIVSWTVNANSAFVEGLEDFPVPEGLVQIDNASLNFGNEEIRLIDVYLSSETLSFAEVAKFYRDTLPQLGWKINTQKPTRCLFEREGEVVEITREAVKPLVVNLTLKSKR